MDAGAWWLGLPISFLLGAAMGPWGHIVLIVSLAFVAIKRGPGWKSYILFAAAPVVIQVLMLAIIGAIAWHPHSGYVYIVIVPAEALSICMIILTFVRFHRTVTSVLVAISNVSNMAAALLLGLMRANDSWL